MSLNAKSVKSIRKTDLVTQKTPFVAFKAFSFAHQATAGETTILLTALVTPTSYAAEGFLQPSVSDLAAADLLLYKRNLSLHSTRNGPLLEYDAYTIVGSAAIRLKVPAEDGEIFVGKVSDVAKSGLQVIDGKTLVATGLIPAGTTDFVVGQAFSLNKYPLTQAGDVLVFIGSQQMFRNAGNAAADPSADGNYEELDAGSGLSNTIRVNVVDPINDRPVLVVSNGMLAERPNGSLRAEIETLAGQNDAIIQTLAVLAGVPESNFQAVPNNVDLQTFGQRVIAMEQNRARIDQPNAWSSAQKMIGRSDGSTPGANEVGETISADLSAVSTVSANTYVDAGGTLLLTPGRWEIKINAALVSLWVAGQAIGHLAIRDSANNVLKRFAWTPVVTATQTTTAINICGSLIVNVTTSTTYKLSIMCQVASAAAVFSIAGNNTAPVGGGVAGTFDSFWYAERRP